MRFGSNQKIQTGKKNIKLLNSFLLIFFLLGCSPQSESTLRIGGTSWIGYESFYLVKKLGYFDDTNIKLVEMTSSTVTIHALRNGSLDGAMLTLDEALAIINDGYNLKVILVLDSSNGADALLAKPEIKSLAELKGKRIAAEYTAVGALMLDSVLKFAQLNINDISLVACDLDSHIECFLDSDAIITFEPIKTELVNRGAKILFDSRQIPGLILDVLVVNEKAIKNHPQSLKKLVEGYFFGKNYMDTNMENSTKIVGEHIKLTAEAVADAYMGIKLFDLDENEMFLNAANPHLQLVADKLVKIMTEKKLLLNKIKTNSITDDQFLPEGK